MVRVAPIKLSNNPCVLWFDPQDIEVHKGDDVVVTTARGTEFGTMEDEIFEASENEIKKLKSPLKPIKRIATDKDREVAQEMQRKGDAALPVFKDMVAEARIDMHPVSVEYLLDGDKAVFYFEAEERVDFRDLVRKLAAHFHVRIDMRQIGVRDEARIVGGLGHCGQELCCKRLGGEFCPVSIRMAKEQDLSLNPQKISGVCGRLMCCLRYEFDAYKDFKSRAPKINATIQTPEGPAKVVDLDVPREVVSLKLEEEKPIRVPLADFDPADKDARPTSVGKQAWERVRKQSALSLVGGSAFFVSQFSGSDKLAEGACVRHTGGASEKSMSTKTSVRKKAKAATSETEVPADSGRRQRRRRSTKMDTRQAATVVVSEECSANQNAKPAKGKQNTTPKKRPKQGASQSKNTSNSRLKDEELRDSQGKYGAHGVGYNADNAHSQGVGPRPGQRSSGLRQKPLRPQNETSDIQSTLSSEHTAQRVRKVRSGGKEEGAAQNGAQAHRHARRRSHKAGGSGFHQGENQ